MGIASDILADWDATLAALAWQVDCGVDEAIGEAPVDRYTAAPPPKIPQPVPQAVTPPAARAAPAPAAAEPARKLEVDPVAVARLQAAQAATLEQLHQAVLGYEHCDLKRGARNTVFADGNPAARLLILTGAPSREEDIEGRAFVGQSGLLLDRMLAAIGVSRQSPDAAAACYVANAVFWRPEGNREPAADEIAMLKPFVQRHIALMDPTLVVVMGNTALLALTGQHSILRARGQWLEALGRPVLPMTHPADLLQNPAAKREAWADLLALKARLQAAK